jgi:hypothetical protein
MALDPLTVTRAALHALAVSLDVTVSAMRADLLRLPADDPQRSTLHLGIDRLLDLDTEVAELIDGFDDLEDETNPPTYTLRRSPAPPAPVNEEIDHE